MDVYNAEAPQPGTFVPVEKPIAPAPIAKVESLEAIMRARVPHAEMEHAITQSNRYSGKVMEENEHSFAQDAGKGKIIIHEKRLFLDVEIVVGSPLTIAYRLGKPDVTARKPREAGKER